MNQTTGPKLHAKGDAKVGCLLGCVVYLAGMVTAALMILAAGHIRLGWS